MAALLAAFTLLSVSLTSAIAVAQTTGTAGTAAGDYDLLVGTYTAPGKSEGIYVYRFDTRSGRASPLSVLRTVNPSYLVPSRDNRYVYAVNELPGDNGPASARGGITAMAFDAASGRLTLLDHVSSEGNDPCYLSISPDGKYLFAANYSVAADPGGSFAVFPLEADGRVGTAALVVHHEGSGPVKSRQDSAHVHSTVFSPDGRYLLAQDLGLDKLFVYRYAPNAGQGAIVSPTEQRYVQMPYGSGPRHLVFDAKGQYAYLTSELAGTVTALQYSNGTLRSLQVLTLAETGFTGKVGAGAIHLSPDGRFLYATNRGDANEIVIFAVNPDDGLLRLVGRQSTLGRTPREFSIDPTGRWLIVGNQDSDTAYVFSRDPQTGRLGPNPIRLDIGSPVDFKFVPAS
ncbi:lactonase family protein [Trinickia symbiotica]|uniref:lactonase family protein n=1 Tax=Trinickia symbiotica TaxID=863227 RepID=UPI003F7A8A43